MATLPYDYEIEYLQAQPILKSGKTVFPFILAPSAVYDADRIETCLYTNNASIDMKLFGNSYMYLPRDIALFQGCIRQNNIPVQSGKWYRMIMSMSPRKVELYECSTLVGAASTWWTANVLTTPISDYGTGFPLFAHTNAYGILYGTNKLASWSYHYSTYLRMSYFKAYKNNVLVCDLIPVSKIENGVEVGYMYDRISKTLLSNQGDSAFICGKKTRYVNLIDLKNQDGDYKKIGAGKTLLKKYGYANMNGTAFDLGEMSQTGDRYIIKATYDQSMSGSRRFLFGCSGNAAYSYVSKQTNNKIGSGSVGVGDAIAPDTYFTYEGIDGTYRYCKVNSVQYNIGGVVFHGCVSEKNMCIGGYQSNIPSWYGKFKSLLWYRNNALYRKIIPFNNNGVCCLKDVIHGTIYLKTSGGSATYGEDSVEY